MGERAWVTFLSCDQPMGTFFCPGVVPSPNSILLLGKGHVGRRQKKPNTVEASHATPNPALSSLAEAWTEANLGAVCAQVHVHLMGVFLKSTVAVESG